LAPHSEDFSHCLPYRYAFGVNQNNPVEYELTETFQFVEIVRPTGSQNRQLERRVALLQPAHPTPAAYPPSDGYQPPEDPLAGVARQVNVARQVRAVRRKVCSWWERGFSYLQEYLPHVAQYVVREGWSDLIGLGRMVLSYPGFCRCDCHRNFGHQVYLPHLQRLHDAPRNGMISGCYPLDQVLQHKPEFQKLKEIKKAVGA